MRRSDKETIPVWAAWEGKTLLPSLRESLHADVCVVGAGIAGLTTAYLLQKEGKKVVVLDAWGLAAGETGRTTAHLTAVPDDRFSELEKMFGAEKTRLMVNSHKSAIDRIERIVGEEGIICGFERVDGYLIASRPGQMELFGKEEEASLRAGFPDRERLTGLPLQGVSPAPALRFPRQAMFNAAAYMQGLAGAFLRKGGRIFGETRVMSVEDGAEPWVVTETGGTVHAGAVVVATNTPVNDRLSIHTKQAAYRTYVAAFEVAKDSYPGFLLWDLQDPYHYVRLLRGKDNDWIVAGGEDHKTGQADDAGRRYEDIESWTRARFSGLGPVTHRWSGQVMEPADSLAFIGRNPGDRNVYIATGDSGQGMTHGTIAGMLVTDLITGRDNPWAGLYDPARKPLRAPVEYARENLNAASRMVSDRILSPGDYTSVAALPPGEGAVIRRGASRIAAYRDEDGALSGLSAACTHVGCVVHWNGGEKSWDCPCHGSRFRTDGRVLNGPATSALEAVEVHEAPPPLPPSGEIRRHGKTP